MYSTGLTASSRLSQPTKQPTTCSKLGRATIARQHAGLRTRQLSARSSQRHIPPRIPILHSFTLQAVRDREILMFGVVRPGERRRAICYSGGIGEQLPCHRCDLWRIDPLACVLDWDKCGLRVQWFVGEEARVGPWAHAKPAPAGRAPRLRRSRPRHGQADNGRSRSTQPGCLVLSG